MPKFTTKRHEQILTSMIAKVVSRTRLSDVSNTSVWKHVLAAAARQDDEQYYQMSLLLLLFDLRKAKGDDLDERAKEIQPAVVTRELEAKSTGNVVFYRTDTTGTLPISIGQQVSTADGTTYTTTAAGSITPTSPAQIPGHLTGQDSGLIPAIANDGGAAGNVEANTIVKFVTKPIGVDGVTNPSRFAHGRNKETDDSFLNRIITYISTLSRGTVEALEFSVLGAEEPATGAVIIFAKAIEDIVNRGYVTLYIDDGTGSASSSEVVSSENVTKGLAGPPTDSAVGGETYLFLDYKPIDSTTLNLVSSISGTMTQGVDYYVNSASGQINFITALQASEVITAGYTRYTGLIELAQKIIDGDPNDRVTYPGYRAAGVQVIVTTPQVLIQTVEISIVVADGYDESEVKDSVVAAIRDYINVLGISGDVLKNEIIKRVQSLAGVYDLTLITPTANVIVLDDQMARTTDANITVN
jgi:uncharacterized phage protein gp47/JayE